MRPSRHQQHRSSQMFMRRPGHTMLKHMPYPSPGHRPQQGFVLIDVLMSILLFSIGILGLVGLQSALTRSQMDSKTRADASYLASELMGQIWSNTLSLSSYTTSGCAAMDRCKEWQDKVASSLPQGSGTVNTDSASGNVTITISWTTPSGETHQYITQTTINQAGS